MMLEDFDWDVVIDVVVKEVKDSFRLGLCGSLKDVNYFISICIHFGRLAFGFKG